MLNPQAMLMYMIVFTLFALPNTSVAAERAIKAESAVVTTHKTEINGGLTGY